MTGFEPLIGWGVGLISSIATDIFKERAKKLADKWDFDLLDRELRRASEQYIKNYEKRHGQLKIVCAGMDAPVKLDEVYTAVEFLDSSTRRYFRDADSLEDWFRKSGKRSFSYSHSTKQKGIKVANREQYLLVLGGPGVGKSTFLRKVGLEALKGKQGEYEHRCIPVMLELRLLTKEITVEQAIAKEFATCGFPEAAEFTTGALENGKLLVLLDGLDEVPSDHLNIAIQQIQDLVDRYGDNRFIASCRTVAYHGGFPHFKDVMMAAFEDEQIEQFIRAWFRSEKDRELGTAQKCWELLNSKDYAAAKELAQTPLLLTLLCVVYDQLQDFPKKRAPLYGEALDVLLSKWAAEKRLERDPIYRELSPELERILLSEIAYDSFAEDQLFFSQQTVTDQIKEFLISNLNAPKHLNSEAVLDAIELQQGILVERARDTYSFSHLTLQEYLTAKYIVDNQQVDWLVENHLTDERWREVFLLVAGFMPGRTGADTLLEKMEQQAQIYAVKPKLQALLQWANEATAGSESAIKPAAKRTAAVFLAITCAIARARALNLDLTCPPLLTASLLLLAPSTATVSSIWPSLVPTPVLAPSPSTSTVPATSTTLAPLHLLAPVTITTATMPVSLLMPATISLTTTATATMPLPQNSKK
ncbi:MAG: NACHT domain-containing protein [Thainema sp.]